MMFTQYRIYSVTEEGNKYSVVFINNSNLKMDQKVRFNEIDGDYFIYRVYGTFDLNEIDEENKKYPVYTLAS